MATAKDMMLCWKPGTDQVKLVPWPDKVGLGVGYTMTSLACWSYVHDMSQVQRKTLVFIEAVILIVRDKCDPMAVHKALMGLEEYQSGVPTDMPKV